MAVMLIPGVLQECRQKLMCSDGGYWRKMNAALEELGENYFGLNMRYRMSNLLVKIF